VGRFSAPMKRLAKDMVTPFWQSKPPIYLGRARRESLHAQAPHRAGDGLVSGHRVNLLERYDYPVPSGTWLSRGARSRERTTPQDWMPHSAAWRRIRACRLTMPPALRLRRPSARRTWPRAGFSGFESTLSFAVCRHFIGACRSRPHRLIAARCRKRPICLRRLGCQRSNDLAVRYQPMPLRKRIAPRSQVAQYWR